VGSGAGLTWGCNTGFEVLTCGIFTAVVEGQRSVGAVAPLRGGGGGAPQQQAFWNLTLGLGCNTGQGAGGAEPPNSSLVVAGRSVAEFVYCGAGFTDLQAYRFT